MWRSSWRECISDRIMEKASLAAPPALDVVLYPNRSLGRAGFAVLMGAIVAVSAAVGAGFMMIGAWPVTGFFGLDVLLIYLAFRWHDKEARRAEFVWLDRDGLSVRRLEPDGSSRVWRFEPYWVRVSLDQAGRHDTRLVLRSHGRQLAIGAFLTPDERLELARTLEAALQAHRAGPTPGDL
jgi:uncharacterized membrane protein